jgi:small GTP-binding protein
VSAPRVLDLVVFGIVNAGKSSLINALAGRDARPTGPVGGTTTEVAVEPWCEVRAEVGPYAVRFVDTPGLEEVGDPGRAAAATAAARQADLILFVTDQDLTASARAALVALRDRGKPLVVAVNKMDLLEPDEQDEVLAAVRRGLDGLIPADDVIAVAAAPLLRRRVEGPDGARRTEVVRGEAQVAALEARLIEAMTASAPVLKALAEASERVERHVASREADRAARRAQAERAADETSAALALALAVNPVPVLDFLTGSGGLAILVRRVAGVYGEALTAGNVQALAGEVFRGGRIALWGSLAAVGAGGVLKVIPGLGHLAGALTQATAAGYFGHVVGRALVEYFDRGHDWGDGGLVAALDRIAAATDRRALTRGLVARLKDHLAGPADPRVQGR